MMEINIKEHGDRINAEIFALQQQLEQLQEKIAMVSQEIIRRQGAIIFLNGLDGEKPKQ